MSWFIIGTYLSGFIVSCSVVLDCLKRKMRANRLIMYDSNQTNCPICYELLDLSSNLAITPCKHRFCLGCLLEHNKRSGLCPVCRGNIRDNRWRNSNSNGNNSLHANMTRDEFTLLLQQLAYIRRINRLFQTRVDE